MRAIGKAAIAGLFDGSIKTVPAEEASSITAHDRVVTSLYSYEDMDGRLTVVSGSKDESICVLTSDGKEEEAKWKIRERVQDVGDEVLCLEASPLNPGVFLSGGANGVL